MTLTETHGGRVSPDRTRISVPAFCAYGGVSPGRASSLELAANPPADPPRAHRRVRDGGASLVYARTATRDAEIATRYALGGSRGRILSQLFAEALVLASAAGVVGLTAAHWALKWGKAAYYSGQTAGPPFWIGSGYEDRPPCSTQPSSRWPVQLILGVLPALKATGSRVQSQLRNLGSGGSTLRFGRVWTAVMIGQVALTVIMIPPAMGIAEGGVARSSDSQHASQSRNTSRCSLELDREIRLECG